MVTCQLLDARIKSNQLIKSDGVYWIQHVDLENFWSIHILQFALRRLMARVKRFLQAGNELLTQVKGLNSVLVTVHNWGHPRDQHVEKRRHVLPKASSMLMSQRVGPKEEAEAKSFRIQAFDLSLLHSMIEHGSQSFLLDPGMSSDPTRGWVKCCWWKGQSVLPFFSRCYSNNLNQSENEASKQKPCMSCSSLAQYYFMVCWVRK